MNILIKYHSTDLVNDQSGVTFESEKGGTTSRWVGLTKISLEQKNGTDRNSYREKGSNFFDELHIHYTQTSKNEMKVKITNLTVWEALCMQNSVPQRGVC